MASASFGDFFNSNNEADLSAYDYNRFIAENGRPPNGADDFRSWQANSYLRDQGLTPQQWINQRWPGVTNATVDSSGNVNYTNYGDGLGEFLGVPAMFGGMMLGANAISGLVNGAGAASAGTGAFDMGGNPSMLGDTPWGVNPQGAGMDLPSVDDWSSGFNGGTSLSDLAPPTNLQDMISRLDMTSGGANSLNDLMTQAGFSGGAADLASNPGLLSQLASKLGMSPSSALQILGRLGAAGLGALGSSNQARALTNLSNQYSGYGAPYRAMLAQSYADPAGFLKNSPDIQAAVSQGTDALARSLSTGGNPTGSGAALQQLQNYATQGLYGQLGNERNRLANFGGLSNFNAASPSLATGAIQAQGDVLNAIGSGISSATNPPTTLEQALNALNANNFKLNNSTGL